MMFRAQPEKKSLNSNDEAVIEAYAEYRVMKFATYLLTSISKHENANSIILKSAYLTLFLMAELNPSDYKEVVKEFCAVDDASVLGSEKKKLEALAETFYYYNNICFGSIDQDCDLHKFLLKKQVNPAGLELEIGVYFASLIKIKLKEKYPELFAKCREAIDFYIEEHKRSDNTKSFSW